MDNNIKSTGIELTDREMLMAWIALTLSDKVGQDGRPQAKTYPMAQLDIAGSCVKKLREVNGNDGDTITFKSIAKIDLKTDEKKIIKDNLALREWTASDAEAVLSLKAKLD